ncbi:ATP-binding protein [Micromonospora halophytica]|uniref:DNA helicase HerA, contains HAS-barrel and ATPase domains n=1 Tax=Micromonospora halophytica TaxID=47864 RepID=A0A1C5J7A4_9ACTN|nr:ATP-binding protein [Micromonospora halophytica]SCG66425.1 DNA helicase HerA, contains HAS-barrel and ATPase domains [Micromonospora halophytica]
MTSAADPRWGVRGWLDHATAYRIVELPRVPPLVDRARGDAGRRQRLAAVVAAYHAAGVTGGGGRTVVGWCRPHEQSGVHVFTGGGVEAAGAAAAADAAGRHRSSLFAGAVGLAYPAGGLAGLLDALPCWTRIAGMTDGLVEDRDDREQAAELRPRLDEGLLGVWQGAFAWLLLADPVPADEVAEQARRLAAQERDAKARGSSPTQAVRALRLGRRHRELATAETLGWWRIDLLAAGTTPQAAAAVAGLLCASVDLHGLPYALAPTRASGDLTGLLERAELATVADEPPRSPGPSPALSNGSFLGSSSLLAALAVPPTEEAPGVRLTLRSDFDVAPETTAVEVSPRPSAQEVDDTVADRGRAGVRAESVAIGAVLDRHGNAGDQLRIPLSSLNRHTFVCGATGAGKSQTVRHLLEQAVEAGLPWLVIEPAKAEYRRMANRLPPASVVAIRPGEASAPPAGFNPLRPVPGFPLQTHADLVRALFLAAFDADEPFPQVLGAALARSYEQLGWDLALGEPRLPGHRPRYPDLSDLQHVAEEVVDQIGYGREVADNVRGFIRVRLASLRLGTTGSFFEGGHPIDIGRLLDSNVVFEIEDVGDDRDKAFLMGALLIQLTEHLRVRVRRQDRTTASTLRHLSVFEESHRLLRRADRPGPAAHAVELFAGLLAEIRAYGEGLVIAEQIPEKLTPDVVKNTAVKIIHRLPARDDRDVVGATVNLTERQSQFVVTLPAGVGAVFTDGMDHPVLVRVPDGSDRENAAPAVTADPAQIIGRRSASCGAACLARPCTLRDMRRAQLLLADQPWLRLWGELAVLGHLTGWPTPAIRAELIQVLRRMPVRLRECALSHAVDGAVAARSAHLSSRCDPDELAEHVVDSLHWTAFGGGHCAQQETEYLAHRYRWAVLRDDLRAEVDAAPAGAGRSARSAEWARRYGVEIPGRTVREQFDAVSALFDVDQRDRAACRVVALGSRTPSLIETAVGAAYDTPSWPDRLTEAVDTHFADCRWPTRVLAAGRYAREV